MFIMYGYIFSSDVVCVMPIHASPVMLAFVEHKQMFTYLLKYIHHTTCDICSNSTALRAGHAAENQMSGTD